MAKLLSAEFAQNAMVKHPFYMAQHSCVLLTLVMLTKLRCHMQLSFSAIGRWLSWMRRPTGDQEVAGLTPTEVGNILSWRLIMKYFLQSFSPFR